MPRSFCRADSGKLVALALRRSCKFPDTNRSLRLERGNRVRGRTDQAAPAIILRDVPHRLVQGAFLPVAGGALWGRAAARHNFAAPLRLERSPGD